MLTPSPKISPSFNITSPTLMPMRNHIRRSSARVSVGLGNIMLDLDGAFYGGKNAAELGKYAVAGGAADPTAMLYDERIGDGPMSRKCCQRAFLIEAHQGAIALDIGGKDCDEFSLEWRGFHGATKSVAGRGH